MKKTAVLASAAGLVFALSVGLGATTKFSATWKSPDAASVSLVGKKVAAMVIDPDDSLRVAGEEALADELTARGMQGVPSYRILPKDLLKDPVQAKVFLERASIEGVVAFRAITAEQVKIVQPATWSSVYYTTLWGYYGQGWGAVYSTGYKRTEHFASMETLIFSVPKNALLWAAVSTTEDQKTARAVVAEVVKESVKEMQKQGLVKK